MSLLLSSCMSITIYCIPIYPHVTYTTHLSILGFFLRPGVLLVFSNLHWCSLHFPGGTYCLFEKSAMSGLVSSLTANLHFRRTLVSIELMCAKYGASWWLCFVTLSPISFKRAWVFLSCTSLSHSNESKMEHTYLDMCVCTCTYCLTWVHWEIKWVISEMRVRRSIFMFPLTNERMHSMNVFTYMTISVVKASWVTFIHV